MKTKKSKTQVNMIAPKNTSILIEADNIINGERRQAYGGALKSFNLIADLCNPVIQRTMEDHGKVTPECMALCMMQLKIARELNKSGRDNMVDIAGYAGCLEKIKADRDLIEYEASEFMMELSKELNSHRPGKRSHLKSK